MNEPTPHSPSVQMKPSGSTICASWTSATTRRPRRDPHYLAELTMSPPFPGGTINDPILITVASNEDCWKVPAGA